MPIKDPAFEAENKKRFPPVPELIAMVYAYVASEDCKGVWPEDDWIAWSEYWDVNIWREEETNYATVYAVRDGTVDMGQGIRIFECPRRQP